MADALDKIEEVTGEAVTEVDHVAEAVKRGVDTFVAEHLRDTLFSRATEAWNHFQSKQVALIEAIIKEVKGL